MLTNKELFILKKDLNYFNQFISKLDHYDILYLTRSKVKDNFSSREIYGFWNNIWKEIKIWKTSDKLEMYIHIPFCEEFCDFCVYYKQLIKVNIEEIVEKYIDYLIKQLEFFAPAFKWATFKCLSVWWWTPSILSARQIKKLFWKLFELYNFDKYAYKWIEFRPSSTNADKLKAIKEVWFETIHFWVQSLDNNVLENMNRNIDTEDKVKDSIDLVKKYNFDNLIIHLIRWLKWDTIEKFKYTLEKICEWGVWDISIYWLVTKEFYLKKHYWLNKTKFYNWWYTEFSNKLREIIPKIAEKYWYKHSKNINIYDHDWILKNKKWRKKRQKYWYQDISSGDINLFALWPSSRSFIEWKIIYETEKKVKYTFNENDKIYLWNILNIKDEMKRKILTWFRDEDRVCINVFNKYFWKNILKEFEDEFKVLKYLWKIHIDDKYIYFLEKNKKMRMLYSCFIAWRENIRRSIEDNNFDLKW